MDVKLPDGRTLRNVPEGTTQVDIIKALKAAGEDTSELEAGWGPGELATDAVRGFVGGSAGLKDLITMPRRLMDEAVTQIKEKGIAAPGIARGGKGNFTFFPQAAETGAALDQVLPQKPALDPTRRYVRAGLEGAGGGFSAPGGSAALVLGAGTVGGLTGQAAADAFGDNPWARALGSTLGAGAVGLARTARPNRQALARETLEGSDPANLAIAVQRMREAQAQGLDINASQAMLRPSNIDDMVAFLANSRQGNETINNLRKQPSKLALRAELEKARLPGEITSPQDTANRVQDAATAAIKDAQNQAGAAYKAALPPGTQIAVPRIEAFGRALDRYSEVHPNTAAAALAQEVKKRLILDSGEAPPATPIGKGAVSSKVTTRAPAKPPTYLTDAEQLKAAIEDALQSHQANLLSTGAVAKDLNRYAQNIRTLFDRTVATPGTPMREARSAAKAVYNTVVDPLKKSVVGRVAGVRGALDTKEAPQAQLKAVLERGTPDSGFSEIKQLEKALRARDPEAFPDLVKTYLADKIDSVLPTEGQRVPGNLAEKLKAALAGTKQQSRGLDDMLAGVARSKSLPEEQVVRGFRNFIDLLAMAERIPNRISGLPVRDTAEIAGQSRVASGFEMRFLGSGLGHKIRATLAADSYKFMDKMLNSPEGLEALQKLAKTGPKHPGSLVLLESLLGGSSNSLAE